MSYITTVKFEMICHVNLLSDSANHILTAVHFHVREMSLSLLASELLSFVILMPNNYILLAGMTTVGETEYIC